jgi:hypothetical protein
VAKVEIEESELANLKRVNDAAVAIGKIPSARAKLQAALAEALPDQAGPEHHLRSEFTEAIGGVSKKIDEFLEGQKQERSEREADAAKRALENRWLEGRAKLRADGVTQEGVEAVEKLMEDEGIPSHEAARLLYERRNPPPEPAVTGGSRWNFFDRSAEAANDTAFKALMDGDDETWLAHSIPAALKEARGG